MGIRNVRGGERLDRSEPHRHLRKHLSHLLLRREEEDRGPRELVCSAERGRWVVSYRRVVDKTLEREKAGKEVEDLQILSTTTCTTWVAIVKCQDSVSHGASPQKDLSVSLAALEKRVRSQSWVQKQFPCCFSALSFLGLGWGSPGGSWGLWRSWTQNVAKSKLVLLAACQANKSGDKVLGQGIMTLFGKPADREDGRRPACLPTFPPLRVSWQVSFSQDDWRMDVPAVSPSRPGSTDGSQPLP
ncbi:hypothetical protein Cadr_000019223 [Camelus dromedarius]|uniref:Uncharacterized protein n=1 Tax=Camelus dromedarius TaxID=9838 RepID=A0A5N4D4C5_CAMDR|nr:hypothetical protein Cadr_000019223 [Camelus dromedarius]